MKEHPCKVKAFPILCAPLVRLFDGFVLVIPFLTQVSAVSTSKTGKHGHAKCNFVAIDIFTGKKYEDIIPSTHTAHVPTVVRKEYILLDITSDDYVSLMPEDGVGENREDVKLPDFPDNYGREIKQAFEAGRTLVVSVVSAMGHDQIVAHKDEIEGAK